MGHPQGDQAQSRWRRVQEDWDRPDGDFFAAGACHILAHTFMEVYPASGFRPFIIVPKMGERGYHVFVARDEVAFDARGYSAREWLVGSHVAWHRRRDPGCDFVVAPLEVPVVTPEFCARYKHLWFDDYHGDPAIRALGYLFRFPRPRQGG